MGALLSVLTGQTNIAGSTTRRRRRRRSGCILTTTKSIRLSGRVNILGTVGVKEEEEDGGRKEQHYTRQQCLSKQSKRALRGRGT